MRLQTLFLAGVLFAPNVIAAELTQDPNLIATSKGQGGEAIYTWTPMLTRVEMDVPYMSFHLGKGADRSPVAPTIVLNVKRSAPLATECSASSVEIDNQVVTPQSMSSVTARLPSGGVLEIRRIGVSLEALRAISLAGAVQYVICGNRATISAHEREGVRGVVGLFDGTIKIRDASDHPLVRPFAQTTPAAGTAQ